jgi:hypothetical protein
MKKPSFLENIIKKEKDNHYILNIAMTALLTLVLLFSLVGGINVDLGSSNLEDNYKQRIVRQNLFQVVDAVLSCEMYQDEAKIYIAKENERLREEYGILDFNDVFIDSDIPYDNLRQFDRLIDELGENASKVNLLKYKFAYAVAIGDVASKEQGKNWQGNRIISIMGQSIFLALFMLGMAIISLVMLVYAVISLIKKKPFTKAKFALTLLLIASFGFLIFTSIFTFVSVNWAYITNIVLTFVFTALYALYSHCMMDEKDLSFTMLIHNGVMVLGGILTFIFMLLPLFKVSLGTQTAMLNWSYIFDYQVAESFFRNVPMAYTLSSLISMMLFLIPLSLVMVFIIQLLNRFMAANYQHNEKKIFLIVTLSITFLVYLVVGSIFASGIGITSLALTVKTVVINFILPALILAGLLVFEIMYKVKPIKKELVFR